MTIENTLLIKVSDLPGSIREAVRNVLRSRAIIDEDLLQDIARTASRAVWDCQVLVEFHDR